MAAIHGKNAVIYISLSAGGTGELVGQQIEWSIDFNTQFTERTKIADSWKTFNKGLEEWYGGFKGNFNIIDTALWDASTGSTERSFYLYPTGGFADFYYGTCWIQLTKIVTGTMATVADTEWKMTGDGSLQTSHRGALQQENLSYILQENRFKILVMP